MDVFWGILFGAIAGFIMGWLVMRVIEAQRGEPEFMGTEPELPPDAVEKHRATWDQSKEEGDLD